MGLFKKTDQEKADIAALRAADAGLLAELDGFNYPAAA